MTRWGQKGGEEDKSKAGPGTGLAGGPLPQGLLLPLPPHQLPLEVAAGPTPAEGWGPEGRPWSGSASCTFGASDSTGLLMGLARGF